MRLSSFSQRREANQAEAGKSPMGKKYGGVPNMRRFLGASTPRTESASRGQRFYRKAKSHYEAVCDFLWRLAELHFGKLAALSLILLAVHEVSTIRIGIGIELTIIFLSGICGQLRFCRHRMPHAAHPAVEHVILSYRNDLGGLSRFGQNDISNEIRAHGRFGIGYLQRELLGK